LGAWQSYKLRLRRRRCRIRAFRKRRDLRPVADRTADIRPSDELKFEAVSGGPPTGFS